MADALYVPWLGDPAVRIGRVPHGALRRRPDPPLPRRARQLRRQPGRLRRRRAVAVPGVHDGAGRHNRHRQHRRRRRRHRLRRTGCAVLDLVLRLRRHRGEVQRGGARRDLSRGRRQPHAHRPDVLPARRHQVAGAGVDLRAHRRRRRVDDDAVHADQFDRARLGLAVRRAEVGLGRSDRRADLARHHRRDSVDRPRGGEADAAQGGPVPRRRALRDPQLRLAHSRRAGARLPGGVLHEGRCRRHAWIHDRDALRPGARHVCERGRLRHRGGRLRHGRAAAVRWSRA